MSATVMVNDAVDLLPSGSDAVHVTGVVLLSWKTLLGGGTQAMLVPALPASR